MPGWSDRVTKPIDQLNPEVARVARLKFNYEISVEKGEWAKAAEYLNGFNDADIISKLKEFGDDGKLEALKKGAEKQMPGWAGRITNPIDGLMKSRDPSLKIADLIPQKGLKGLELRMATIYNTKGKYLEDKATELSIDSASAAAVLYVESSGAGFNDAGRMIIRFENHVFFDNWGKSNVKEFKKYFKFNSNEKWKGHYFRVIETDAWRSFHGEQNIEWEVFEFARALNEEAALKSISMGLGQVMGFNYSKTGFSSVKDMFDSMSGSLRLQLDGMFNFFKNTPLCIKGLKEKDYVKFATGYNGTGQAAQYGANIKAAADAYIKVIQKHKTTNSSK
jgi:N-acetylmuramidase